MEELLCEATHSQSIRLFIKGKAVGANVVVDRASIDFGLVRVGAEASAHISVRNPHKVPAQWSMDPVYPSCDLKYVLTFVFNFLCLT